MIEKNDLRQAPSPPLHESFAVDPTPDSPRPPVKLDVLRRQLAGITEYLRANVWPKPPAT